MWKIEDYILKKEDVRDRYREEFPKQEDLPRMQQKSLAKKRIATLLREIDVLSNSKPDQETMLTCYVTCIFAISHWRKRGNWDPTKLKRVSDTASYILGWYGNGEALSVMERDLQRQLGALYYGNSEFADALKNEYTYARSSSTLNRALHSLSVGCIDHCQGLLLGETGPLKEVLQLKIHRLSQAYSCFDATFQCYHEPSEEHEWERMLKNIAQDPEKISHLVEAIDEPESVYAQDASYFIEAYLYSKTIGYEGESCLDHKLSTTIKARSIQYQTDFKPVWQFALGIEELEPGEKSRAEFTALATRVLDKIFFLPVDKKLIFLAYAAKTAKIYGADDLGEFLTEIYASQSLLFSRGKSTDCLNIKAFIDMGIFGN